MDKLKLLMALLTIYENNFRVLHWKLSGTGFHTAHERYGGYYDSLGDHMDMIAEQIISLGGKPVNMQEALSTIESSNIHAIIIAPNESYHVEAADRAAYTMFNLLYQIADEINNSDLMPDVIDVTTELARYYRVEGYYKLGRALESAPIEAPTQETPITGPEELE